MSVVDKTVSALVGQQLPDFVRSDHPQFKRFLELYYAWLEDEAAGNTVYHIMHSDEYRDIDETLDPFIRLFKQELLPYFPETSALDLVKILKGAREFYVKKGSEESVQWLFRVLFGEDIEIFYPKEQILIASDGKWKLPQAFNLTLSAENDSLDVNLLEKHLATGSISKATCVIESANKTIDKTFGNEILEMYVSNVDKSFENGEYLEIYYTDENGDEQLFSEKIIGSISSIIIDSNIRTDPQQKRRGLLYNVGDPVVVYAGLADTNEANDAVAIVGNVSVGSIEGLTIAFPGYGYRTYSNTEVVVYSTPGDTEGANASVDIRVSGINTADSETDSQAKFYEQIQVDMMPIAYMADYGIDTASYDILTGNNRNIVVTIDNDGDPWYAFERLYADGGSYETANFTCQILTSNTGWAGGPTSVILYNVQNTEPVTTGSGYLIGIDTLISTESGSVFNVSAVTVESLPANQDSQIWQTLSWQDIDTGGVALYNLLNGGYGFRATPTVTTSSYFDTFWSMNYAYGTPDNIASRQPLGVFGKIAHVYINNGGDGYANGEPITIAGRGYDFDGYITVGAGGAITSVDITNRGEGYYGTPSERTVSITTSGGANAVLTSYGFGQGVQTNIETGAIGRVRDVRMLSRGYDYIEAPTVSFKVMDMVINEIAVEETLPEGERVWQGATFETNTFQGIIKEYKRTTGVLRLFNYSGIANTSLPFTTNAAVTFTTNATANVPAPSLYPASVISSGLPNPYFYGNGKARGYAEFYNGLIQFPGFYINTDGFVSSDKKLQDGRVYHNYSYVIESERSLYEYENPMKDIVHPIGMIMLSHTITRSFLLQPATIESTVAINKPNPTESTVYVNNYWIPTISGNATQWDEVGGAYSANVGDMILIQNSTYPLRNVARIITAINSNTELEVDGNFEVVGDGRLTVTTGSNVVYVTGNTNPIDQFILPGDEVSFDDANSPYIVDIVSANTLSLNTTYGLPEADQNNIVYIVGLSLTTNHPYDIINLDGN